MESFHLKRLTPVESLSSRRNRRKATLQSGCVSGSEIRATSLGCNKHFTITTTTEETKTSITVKTNSTTISPSETNTHISQLLLSLALPLAQPHLLTLSSPLACIRRSLWNCLHLRHDSTCIMMTMFFLISVVLSGNSALAAQRESFKSKDTTNNISNNPNAIFNEIGSSSAGSVNGSGLSNSSGNGNAVSHSNVSNISNGNSNTNSNNIGISNILTQKATAMLTTSTSTSTTSSAGSSGYATTTSTHTTSSHKTSSSNRNSIEMQETSQSGPYFDKGASKNVTALLGKTAYLNCRVKNLGNKTMLLQVSWVRHRDIHLLTVGRYTYTSDQRFRAIHQPQTEDWILQIKYPQHRDSGIYECQVSTTPHMSHYIHLNVVEPSTEIIGAPDLYIESGSTINLTCVILNSPEPPAYIFWNHNNAIINYDSPRGGVSVVTIKGETTTSFLLIKSARPSDSGHYQCNPSNAKHKIVTVHVLNGVSHSVSRGIPSSNAARGTSTSSNVSKSLYLSVPVNALVYLSICQALHKATGYSSWSKICGHVIEKSIQLLGYLLLTLSADFVNVLTQPVIANSTKNDMQIVAKTLKTKVVATEAYISSNNNNTACCYYMQLRESDHPSCRALQSVANTTTATIITTTTTTTKTNTSTTAVAKCSCKRPSLSVPLSSPSLSSSLLSAPFIISCALDIWNYLLYSKEHKLYKNKSSATSTASAPLSSAPCRIDNFSGLSCRCTSRCRSALNKYLYIQSTFFSESDIR